MPDYRSDAPSGLAPVAGSFSATGASASFQPIRRADFNITISGTFVGTVLVERSFDAGATWHAKWPTEIYAIADPRSFSDNEPEYGVLYRLRCSAYTSGTISYRISQ